MDAFREGCQKFVPTRLLWPMDAGCGDWQAGGPSETKFCVESCGGNGREEGWGGGKRTATGATTVHATCTLTDFDVVDIEG